MAAVKKKTLPVGHISSLTWNRLDVNRGRAHLPEAAARVTSADTKFESLPEGFTHRKLSYTQAAKYLEAHAPEEPAEAVVAGKVPIYHPQRFGTGLGADYEAFLEGVKTPFQLLELAAGVKAETPVLWDTDFANGQSAADGRILHLGQDAEATVLLVSRSEKGAEGLAASQTKVRLDDGAKLTLVLVQMLGNGFVSFEDLGAALGKDASLDLIQMELGGKDSYTGTQAELVGDGAKIRVRNGYLGKGTRTVDINYNVIQRGRKTQCDMEFNGVLDDASKKRFTGTIDFRRGSKKSVGHERENVLLLSDDVVNKTLPIILCEEEDMEGTHGATIGELDPAILFYLATRGIDRTAAEQMMVRARLGAVAAGIPMKALRDEIHDFVEEAFTA